MHEQSVYTIGEMKIAVQVTGRDRYMVPLKLDTLELKPKHTRCPKKKFEKA